MAHRESEKIEYVWTRTNGASSSSGGGESTNRGRSKERSRSGKSTAKTEQAAREELSKEREQEGKQEKHAAEANLKFTCSWRTANKAEARQSSEGKS